jgi:hypothetical protein
MAFSPAPTVDEMNAKLRAMASKVGANAVINIEYNSGVSMTSWKSMKGTGLAVRKLSDDISCPICAETIKRAAKRCRYCGAEIEHILPISAIPSVPSTSRSTEKVLPEIQNEPLRETNNPQLWLIVGAGLFLLLMLISMGG